MARASPSPRPRVPQRCRPRCRGLADPVGCRFEDPRQRVGPPSANQLANLVSTGITAFRSSISIASKTSWTSFVATLKAFTAATLSPPTTRPSAFAFSVASSCTSDVNFNSFAMSAAPLPNATCAARFLVPSL